MQTREQVYATAVYELVSRVGVTNKEDKAKYGSMAHKLPVLIRSAGLTQALVFVATRSDAQKNLLPDLATVLGFTHQNDLLKAARTADLPGYMLLTEHALAALLWFKRYAQSVLEVDGTED
jgi:CRISPR-associated protein Cmr5